MITNNATNHMTSKKSNNVTKGATKDVKTFLLQSSQEKPSRCFTCNHAAAAKATVEFFAEKAAGRAAMSGSRFFRSYIIKELGFTGGLSAWRSHVVNCLKIDMRTGKEL